MTAADLSEQQRRAVEMLAAGTEPAAVADACAVSARTLRRWRNRPDFAAAVADAVSGTFRDARSAVLAASVAAADVARALMLDGHTPAPTRARLALGVLDLADRFARDDLAARLDRLEAIWDSNDLRAV
ncbi:helix-turn-helix domain-containing protein [Flexivirga sp. B27]